MKVIIIEGTDNVGKDTVINRLTHEFDCVSVYHCEKPSAATSEEQAEEQERAFIKLMGQTLFNYSRMSDYDDNFVNGTAIIHNRSWYGEYVYGCMYRDNDEEMVKEMLWHLEKCLNATIKQTDLCYITLLSNNSDFLVRNDDGLSISNAKRELIEEETKRFEKVHELSSITNKHIIYVNNGDKFRDKNDIYNEVLKYINNEA